MLIALAVILAIAWLLGFTVFHVASAAIHILIALAVVALIVHFVQGRGGAGRGTLAPR
ncbi:MAG TPA: lmo0937 family membrane protein [Kofleriaceae bacterium]|nr:lmo0937 family membrane protein [Kofleriaceae bacterium]